MLGEWPESGGAGLKTEKNRPVGRRCGKTAELCSCLWRLLGGASELCSWALVFSSTENYYMKSL